GARRLQNRCMYSLVSAPVLGFDLTRLPGGSAAADVLRRGLTINDGDLDAIAAARTDDDCERAAAWRDVDAAARKRRTLRTHTAPIEAGASDLAGALAVLERTPLGTVDGLLHCLRYDILDWTWDGRKPGSTRSSDGAQSARIPRQRTGAVDATGVL